MVNKENLTELQQQKLADIIAKGYANNIPEDDDGAIAYLDRWQIRNVIESDETEMPTTKKAKGRLTDEERLEKIDKDIARHLQIIEDLKNKKVAIEENRIKKLLANHTYSELAELLKTKEN